jgi:hypothetical protein
MEIIMKKILIAMLIACACVTACASNDAGSARTRSSAVETLPAENK